MMTRPAPTRTMTVDRLAAQVYASRDDMGAAAAYDVARRMQEIYAQQEWARIVFAAAPSSSKTYLQGSATIVASII